MLSAVLFHGCLGKVTVSEETRRKLLYQVADPGEGIRGPALTPLDQTEARRAEKIFFGDRPPPLSKGPGWQPPPPHPHLKVWKSQDPALYSEPFSDSGSTRKSVFFERLIYLAPWLSKG